MLHKTLLASVAALGLLVPLGAGSRAKAGPAVVVAPPPVVVGVGHPYHHCFRVLYRGCAREPWRVYGTYHSDHRAHEVARHLRHDGFRVRVVEE